MSKKVSLKFHKSDKQPVEDKQSLKLVLKFGSGSGTPEQSEVIQDEHDGDKKHKHKKKKKKHKRHKEHDENEPRKEKEKKKPERTEERVMSDGDEEAMIPPPAKKRAVESEQVTAALPSLQATSPPIAGSMSLRERKPIEDETTPLQRCLDQFHKVLVRKDINGFFAYPVTDNIAPSYSKIIHKPMDFTTIMEKIEENEYSSVMAYKADFQLMCHNCMTYNHPETIYYREAEKLLKYGIKQLSKEKLLHLKRNHLLVALPTDHELGLDHDPAADGSTTIDGAPKPIILKPKVKKAVLGRYEAFPDRLTPEQILAQAQDAAKDAGEQLTLRKPNTRFGFLRRREDGSTTINLLNPENDGIVSEKERVVNLGSLIGKLSNGTGTVAGFKEDKRNKATPVNYMNYGPFSSYAPIYDSTLANLTKDDSDLLMTAYGDDAGTQYTYSIRQFVADAGDYAVRMVDNLLDTITGGDHTKALTVLDKVEQTQKEPVSEDIKVDPAEQDVLQAPELPVEPPVDFNELRTLSDLGIDVGFLDVLETSLKKEQAVQKQLDDTSCLLRDLQETQYDRLGKNLPSHLDHIEGPGDKERELANKVTQELKDLVRQASPADVSTVKAIRNALGVTLTPDPTSILEPPPVTTSATSSTDVTMMTTDTPTEPELVATETTADLGETLDFLQPMEAVMMEEAQSSQVEVEMIPMVTEALELPSSEDLENDLLQAAAAAEAEAAASSIENMIM